MKRKRPALFKGRHFEAEIIVLAVRWYLAATALVRTSAPNRQMVVCDPLTHLRSFGN